MAASSKNGKEMESKAVSKTSDASFGLPAPMYLPTKRSVAFEKPSSPSLASDVLAKMSDQRPSFAAPNSRNRYLYKKNKTQAEMMMTILTKYVDQNGFNFIPLTYYFHTHHMPFIPDQIKFSSVDWEQQPQEVRGNMRTHHQQLTELRYFIAGEEKDFFYPY